MFNGRLVGLIAFLVLVDIPLAISCTTLGIFDGNERIVGKSYDWDRETGAVYVNQRNITKKAITFVPGEVGVRWASKYASYTFNQHGREFPVSGMNEKGLVVEVMWLEETALPPADSRPVINELQWVQYQLDNFASVEEALTHLEEVRVSRVYAPLHYMLCDISGVCASVEFLNGKTAVHTGESMPVKVLANHSYQESVLELKKYLGFGGAIPVPTGLDSLSRFVRHAYFAKQYNAKADPDAVSYVFNAFASYGYSKTNGDWNLVYDLAQERIYFRTKTRPQVKAFETAGFSLDCRDNEPVQMLLLAQEQAGDMKSKFFDYSASVNKTLIQEGLNGLPGITSELVDVLAAYPQTTLCQ